MSDEEKVMELLKGAYDRGLNTWDTANAYSNGGMHHFSMPTAAKFEKKMD